MKNMVKMVLRWALCIRKRTEWDGVCNTDESLRASTLEIDYFEVGAVSSFTTNIRSTNVLDAKTSWTWPVHKLEHNFLSRCFKQTSGCTQYSLRCMRPMKRELPSSRRVFLVVEIMFTSPCCSIQNSEAGSKTSYLHTNSSTCMHRFTEPTFPD